MAVLVIALLLAPLATAAAQTAPAAPAAPGAPPPPAAGTGGVAPGPVPVPGVSPTPPPPHGPAPTAGTGGVVPGTPPVTPVPAPSMQGTVDPRVLSPTPSASIPSAVPGANAPSTTPGLGSLPSVPGDTSGSPFLNVPTFGPNSPLGQFQRWVFVPPRAVTAANGQVFQQPGFWTAETTTGVLVTEHWELVQAPTGELVWRMVPRAFVAR